MTERTCSVCVRYLVQRQSSRRDNRVQSEISNENNDKEYIGRLIQTPRTC